MVSVDEVQEIQPAPQQEEKARLEGKRLLVATPCYAGQCHAAYARSLILLASVCKDHGVPLKINFLMNESLVQRGRNRLVAQFLETDATHLLFIDSDIQFDPMDVLHLLHLCEGERKVIGGAYSKKNINWRRVTEAVKQGKTSPEELSAAAADACFNFAPATLDPAQPQLELGKPVEVLDLPTGFMMIHRSVFEAMIERHPETRYEDDIEPPFKTMYALFDCYIRDGRYLSEDYAFVRRWQDMGNKVFLCPWMATHHFGTHAFRLDLPALARSGINL